MTATTSLQTCSTGRATVSPMLHRWSAVYAYHWPPILTFEARRHDALAWLESNANVVSFLDRDREFGVAIGRRALRIVVRPNGMEILLNDPDAEFDGLSGALGGLLALLAPRRMHAGSARLVMSSEISGEYDAVRRANARFIAGDLRDAEPYDFSTVLDLTVDGNHVAVEYGIVDARELRERLTDFDMGRLNAAEMPPLRQVPDDLAAVSVFADVAWRTGASGSYEVDSDVDSTVGHVRSRIDEIDAHATKIVSGLSEAVQGRWGSGELSRGA